MRERGGERVCDVKIYSYKIKLISSLHSIKGKVEFLRKEMRVITLFIYFCRQMLLTNNFIYLTSYLTYPSSKVNFTSELYNEIR